MGQHDANQGEVHALQNRFTRYLLVALERKKRDYMEKRSRPYAHEVLTDFQNCPCPDSRTRGMDELSLELENITLARALSQLNPRERYIFFARVLNDKSYEELAARLGMRYSGVASAYHRAVRKLKKALQGGET